MDDPCKLSIFPVRTASNCFSWSQQLPLTLTVNSGVLTGVDRLLGEVEDGVLQGRIEGERLKLLQASENVGKVSPGPDSQSAKIS